MTTVRLQHSSRNGESHAAKRGPLQVARRTAVFSVRWLVDQPRSADAWRLREPLEAAQSLAWKT